MRLFLRRIPGVQSMIVFQHPDHIELKLFVVRSDRRKQGVGHRAMEYLKSVAREVSLPIRLKVDAPRARGLKTFYASCGFSETGRLSMEWSPGFSVQTRSFPSNASTPESPASVGAATLSKFPPAASIDRGRDPRE